MAGIPNIDIDPPKYGPPNMAAQLFSMISSLPDAYQQGVKQKFERGQMARTEEQQKPYTGRLDPMEIMHESMRRGGIEDAQKYVGPLLEMMGNRQINEGLGGGGSRYSPSNPNTTPDSQTAPMLRPQGQRAAGEAQPQGPAGEDTAHQNIRQLAINAGIDPQSDAFRQAFAKTDIDREFSSDAQRTGAALKITGLKRLAGGDAGPSSPTAALGRGEGTVYMPGPGMQGAPQAGQPGQPPVQMAQAAPRGPAGTPVGTEAEAQQYEAEARRLLGVSTAPFAKPAAAEAARKAADQAAARAKDIRDTLAKYGEPTGEMKNAASPVVQQSKGLELAQKQELTRGDHLQTGIQGAAREFETSLKPHLDAMRGILNNPNFVSGAGVGFQEALNKIRSSPLFAGLPGYDPNAALPNEAIRKVVAASILNQTTELKAEAAEMGGSAGRLFQQQITLMEKAAQNPENTAPALRYLTELQTRMGDHARGIAELANNYQGKYGKGVLDNGFNEVLSKYNRENPIFKEAEIKDMRRFAPPPAPAFHTEDDAKAWARKNNIPVGDPIKMPSGKIIPAP
jgi:hypothetical protein